MTRVYGATEEVLPDLHPDEILMQLDRLLASRHFKNSSRYPNLLRYIVKKTLDGHAKELKERTVGIEVFGRKPDYDQAQDPVVRVTAGKVRERIAQYYHEPEHYQELRIDLPPGSYIAEFICQSSSRSCLSLPALRTLWLEILQQHSLLRQL